jgi:hypothetical protein
VSTTPPLPSLRALACELRALHEAWSHPDAGGEYVTLALEAGNVAPAWRVVAVSQVGSMYLILWDGVTPMRFGHEYVPGSVERECSWCDPKGSGDGAGHLAGLACPECDGSGRVSVPSPFDATAAARRLLAAARDGLRRGGAT